MTDSWAGKFRHCLLRRGPAGQYAWIPAAFAEVGRPLRLKNADGGWDDGWRVERAYGRMPGSRVRDLGLPTFFPSIDP